MTQELVWFVGLTGYMLLCFGVTGLLYFSTQRQRVVRIDPPENDERLIYFDGMFDDDTLMREVNQRKELDIFQLALIHLNGWCSVLKLWEVVQENHNAKYRDWPEFKHLIITKKFLEETLQRRELGQPQNVVLSVPKRLTQIESPYDGDFIPHVLAEIPHPQGTTGRCLMSVWHLADVYKNNAPARVPEPAVYPLIENLTTHPAGAEIGPKFTPELEKEMLPEPAV